MWTFRKTAALGVGVVVVVVAVGVTSSGGSGHRAACRPPAPTAEMLYASMRKSNAARSTYSTATVTAVSGDKKETATVRGFASSDGRRAALSAVYPGRGSFEERIVGGVAYVNTIFLQGGPRLPAGVHWIAAPIRKIAPGSLSANAQQQTAAYGLVFLTGLRPKVTKVDVDTIGGDVATHYRGSLDPTSAALRTRRQHRQHPRAPPARWRSCRRVGRRAWPRREDASLLDATGDDGVAKTLELTLEIGSFNLAFVVEAPPANQTIGYDRIPRTELI